MTHTPRGTIIDAIDQGTIWQLLYKTEQGHALTVEFDHRPFAAFYEGATGRDFFHDYRYGSGFPYVAKMLRGIRISVEGDQFAETVHLED